MPAGLLQLPGAGRSESGDEAALHRPQGGAAGDDTALRPGLLRARELPAPGDRQAAAGCAHPLLFSEHRRFNSNVASQCIRSAAIERIVVADVSGRCWQGCSTGGVRPAIAEVIVLPEEALWFVALPIAVQGSHAGRPDSIELMTTRAHRAPTLQISWVQCHAGLQAYTQQANNYVVYHRYFDHAHQA